MLSLSPFVFPEVEKERRESKPSLPPCIIPWFNFLLTPPFG
jgi:hypothetical protein